MPTVRTGKTGTSIKKAFQQICCSGSSNSSSSSSSGSSSSTATIFCTLGHLCTCRSQSLIPDIPVYPTFPILSSSETCSWPYTPRVPNLAAFWVFSVAKNESLNTGCQGQLPGWPSHTTPQRVHGYHERYSLPNSCVQYIELRKPAGGDTTYNATDILTRFMKDSFEGGANLKAIIILGQLNFYPAKKTSVVLDLVMEQDQVDLVVTTYRFVMRQAGVVGSATRPTEMRVLLALMIALLCWWLIKWSDVFRVSVYYRVLYILLVIMSFLDVSILWYSSVCADKI